MVVVGDQKKLHCPLYSKTIWHLCNLLTSKLVFENHIYLSCVENIYAMAISIAMAYTGTARYREGFCRALINASFGLHCNLCLIWENSFLLLPLSRILQDTSCFHLQIAQKACVTILSMTPCIFKFDILPVFYFSRKE